MADKSDILQDDAGPSDGSVYDLAQKVDYWKSVRKASKSTEFADERFTEDPERAFRYELRPLAVMIPLGTVGLLLFIAQLFLPYNLLQTGNDDYTGYLRLAMMLAGAYCIFLAWPRYRDTRVTDQEEEETEALRERLWRLKYRK